MTKRIGQHRDEELPEDKQQFIEDLITNTAILNEKQIPRYNNLPTAQPIELHVFCDASGSRHSHFHPIRRQNSLPCEIRVGKKPEASH